MLNRLLIYEYINKLKKEDIINFSKTQGINLNNQEINIIYEYIKKDYKKIFNNPEEVLNEAKLKLNNTTYLKLNELYINNKNKIKSL